MRKIGTGQNCLIFQFIGGIYMDLTIKRLQEYLQEKYTALKPKELKNHERYFLKLVEEVGELAEVIRKDKRMTGDNIKGTIEEEISDVLYYVAMIANTYDIDLETAFRLKEQLNKKRYRNNFKIDK